MNKKQLKVAQNVKSRNLTGGDKVSCVKNDNPLCDPTDIWSNGYHKGRRNTYMLGREVSPDKDTSNRARETKFQMLERMSFNEHKHTQRYYE